MADAKSSSSSAPRLSYLRLDPTLYNPSPVEVEFFKQQTGIKDDEKLKEHILAVQKEAWEVVNYRCIQSFGFMSLKISRLPPYKSMLELAKQRPGAIYLDYACCFGNDVRKAIWDGFPREDCIASDLQQEFWDLGHSLFKSTPGGFPVPFVKGNIFDKEHISPAPPCYSSPSAPRPDLKLLKSLTPLQGYVSAIHVSGFFHLFRQDDQIYAAKALASLLSPLPGSMIFGMHKTTGGEESKELFLAGDRTIYGYTPEDWKKLWNGEVFKEGTIEVEVETTERERYGNHDEGITEPVKRVVMVWCVRRL